MHGKIQKNVSYCMELKVITTKNLQTERILDTQVCFPSAVLCCYVQKSQNIINTLLVHLMDVYLLQICSKMVYPNTPYAANAISRTYFLV